MPGRFASVWPPSMAVALGHRADQSPPLPWTKAPWHHTAKHSYPARRPVCAPRIRGAASRPGTLTAAHRLAAGHRCSGETGARCGRAALGSGAMTSWAGPADRASRLRGQQRGSAASILRITVDVPCVVCACTASAPRRRGWTGRRLTWAWPRAGAAGSCPLPWALGMHKGVAACTTLLHHFPQWRAVSARGGLVLLGLGPRLERGRAGDPDAGGHLPWAGLTRASR